MRRFWIATLIAGALAPPAAAQEPVPGDTLRAPADTTETIEEIEARLLEELGAPDTARGATPVVSTGQPAGTLNPDISLIADFLVDLSPDEATLEDGDRLQLREIELGIQGAVDPYFRYDAFVAIHGDEVEIEEAYATTLGLPAGLQVKLGRMLLPMGKVNLTHVPELETIDHALVVQEFFGEEGFSSTGVWTSVFGAPFGFPQEVSLVLANGAEAHGHGEEDEHEEEEDEDEEHEEGKDLLDDLADRLWVAHFKNSIDLTPASNLEIGASWGTSAVDEPERIRTNLYGLDATWRWRPLAAAKYRSAVLRAEAFWRRDLTEDDPRFGGFAFGQWQLARRWYVGARYDYVEGLEEEEGTLEAGQVLVRWFPTEFSQLRLAYERRAPEIGDAVDRLLFQTTFALGPHRPHAF